MLQDEVKKLQERLKVKEAECEKLQTDIEDQVRYFLARVL